MKNKEEFKLSEKILHDKCWVDDGEEIIPVEDIKEFIQRLKEASRENDWEFAHNDGNEEDGFMVISGEEFIDNLTGFKEEYLK